MSSGGSLRQVDVTSTFPSGSTTLVVSNPKGSTVGAGESVGAGDGAADGLEDGATDAVGELDGKDDGVSVGGAEPVGLELPVGANDG